MTSQGKLNGLNNSERRPNHEHFMVTTMKPCKHVHIALKEIWLNQSYNKEQIVFRCIFKMHASSENFKIFPINDSVLGEMSMNQKGWQ